MGHGLPEWFDLDGGLARLQEIPIVLQFVAVNLRPRLDEPLLCLRQAAAQTLDRVQREDRGLLLVERVEMRPMMRPPASTNIRMMIPKNRDSSGTSILYIVGIHLSGSSISFRRANG